MMKITLLDEGIIWKNPHPSATARVALWGQSVSLGGGEILHTMQVGEARMNPGCRCMIARSHDGGKSWSQPAPLVIHNRPDWFPTFAMLSRRPDGTLLASANRNRVVLPGDPQWLAENGGWIGTETQLLQSADNGQAWSAVAPIPVPDHPGGFFVVSSAPQINGDELFVILEPMFSGSTSNWNHQDEIIRSNDSGKTWGSRSIIAKDPTGKIIYFDPRLTRLRSGRWCCLLWRHDSTTDQSLQAGIMWADASSRHWTEPRELPFWGFLSVPLALADGRLLAVYNHRRDPQQIRCILSEDEGETWQTDGQIVLWDQSARRATGLPPQQSRQRPWEGSALAEMFSIFDFGIPHAIQLDDGIVFISFYATGLDHLMHQRYVRLRVE